jgi:hypothetical protein
MLELWITYDGKEDQLVGIYDSDHDIQMHLFELMLDGNTESSVKVIHLGGDHVLT